MCGDLSHHQVKFFVVSLRGILFISNSNLIRNTNHPTEVPGVALDYLFRRPGFACTATIGRDLEPFIPREELSGSVINEWEYSEFPTFFLAGSSRDRNNLSIVFPRVDLEHAPWVLWSVAARDDIP